MTKKNQQLATSETAENLAITEAAKNRLLNIDKDGYWIKFFKETAVKLAFKAKGLTEEKALLFYGRFFRSFAEKLADLEETNEEELGAQLASKLVELSRTDTQRKYIQDRINGLKGRIAKLEEEAARNPAKAQQIAAKSREYRNEIQRLEQDLQQL